MNKQKPIHLICNKCKHSTSFKIPFIFENEVIEIYFFQCLYKTVLRPLRSSLTDSLVGQLSGLKLRPDHTWYSQLVPLLVTSPGAYRVARGLENLS